MVPKRSIGGGGDENVVFSADWTLGTLQPQVQKQRDDYRVPQFTRDADGRASVMVFDESTTPGYWISNTDPTGSEARFFGLRREENLIQQSGVLDRDVAGWATTSMTDSAYANGVVTMTTNTTGTAEWYYDGIGSDTGYDYGLEEGDVVRFSVDIKLDSLSATPNQTSILIESASGSSANIIDTPLIANQGEWARYSYSRTLLSGDTYVNAVVNHNGKTGVIYHFRNPQVQRVSYKSDTEPSEYVPNGGTAEESYVDDPTMSVTDGTATGSTHPDWAWTASEADVNNTTAGQLYITGSGGSANSDDNQDTWAIQGDLYKIQWKQTNANADPATFTWAGVAVNDVTGGLQTENIQSTTRDEGVTIVTGASSTDTVNIDNFYVHSAYALGQDGCRAWGVKYFDYDKNNSTDGFGEVTEANGSAITNDKAGVLIEPTRTNETIKSEDIDKSLTQWAGNTHTIAPTGDYILGKPITELAFTGFGATNYYLFRNNPAYTPTEDQYFVISCLVASASGNGPYTPGIGMRIIDGSGYQYAYAVCVDTTDDSIYTFDQSGGGVTFTSTGASAEKVAAPVGTESDWYLLTLRMKWQDTSSTIAAIACGFPVSSTTPEIYYGVLSAKSMGFVACFQIEDNVQDPSSFIETDTSSVTRGSDVLVYDGANFVPQGTYYIEYYAPPSMSIGSSIDGTLFYYRNNTTAWNVELQLATSQLYWTYTDAYGLRQFLSDSGEDYTSEGLHKIAIRTQYRSDSGKIGVEMWHNGTKPATQSRVFDYVAVPSSTPVMDQLWIGSDNAGVGQLNVHYRKMKVYDKWLNDDEMDALTAV